MYRTQNTHVGGKLPMNKKIILYVLALLTIVLISACGSDVPTSSSNNTATPTPESTPKLDLPDEQTLIKTYTDELSKLTNSSIISTRYENYEEEDSVDDKIIYLDIIANMNDGKTLEIPVSYIDSWEILAVKNKDNSHNYFLGNADDFTFMGDYYDYSTDTLISKDKFQTKNSLKKVTFLTPSHWKKTNSKTGYSFYNDETHHYTMVFYAKAPFSSLDQTWKSLNFDDYSLKEEENIKIGGKTGKKWHFTYSDDGIDYEAVCCMAKNEKDVYIFMVMTPSPWFLDDWVFNAVLESVEWKK